MKSSLILLSFIKIQEGGLSFAIFLEWPTSKFTNFFINYSVENECLSYCNVTAESIGTKLRDLIAWYVETQI